VPLYACASHPPALAALSTEALAESEAVSAAAAAADDPLQELAQSCYRLRSGFWTYELCPFRRVSQAHEPERKRAGTAHAIGRYVPARDHIDTALGEYWQEYSGGDQDRSARVRFVCPDASASSQVEAITLVIEPSSRSYEFTFQSAAVCRGILRPDARAGLEMEPAEVARWRPRPLGGSPGALALPGARLLAPLKGRCFVKTDDYWSYEFCAGKHLRQFRPDRTRRNAPSMLLGVYDAALDEVFADAPRPYVTPARGLIHTLFSQTFFNGTSKRSATVHVACARGTNEHALWSVTEPSPLRYEALFATPLACDLNCVRTKAPPLANAAQPRDRA
jgi:hypothetical protein